MSDQVAGERLSGIYVPKVNEVLAKTNILKIRVQVKKQNGESKRKKRNERSTHKSLWHGEKPHKSGINTFDWVIALLFRLL